MVPVPLLAPQVLAPRKPSVDPDPETSIVWPAATTLSFVLGGSFGQVKVSPSCTSAEPAVTPTLASACSEKLAPAPSRFAPPRLVSLVIAALLYADWNE